MKAGVLIQGKEYLVQKGDKITVSRLSGNPEDTLTFDKVTLLIDKDYVKVGTPKIEGAEVVASLIEHKKGKKVRVATYQPKKRHRNVKGYRDSLSVLGITEIKAG